MKKPILALVALTLVAAAGIGSQLNLKKEISYGGQAVTNLQNMNLRKICWITREEVNNFNFKGIKAESRVKAIAQIPMLSFNVPYTNVQDTYNSISNIGCELVISSSEYISREMYDFANSESGRKLKWLLYGSPINGYNVSSWFAYLHEPGWVFGQLAARVSKTHKIGFVAPTNEPSYLLAINGFYQGATESQIPTSVYAVFVNKNNSYEAEFQAVKKLIASGVDVIFALTDTTAPIRAIDNENVKLFGAQEQLMRMYPQYFITTLNLDYASFINNWLQDYLNKGWKSDNYELDDFKYVSVSSLSNVPPNYRQVFEHLISQLKKTSPVIEFGNYEKLIDYNELNPNVIVLHGEEQ